MRGLHTADWHLNGQRLSVISRCLDQIREHGPYDYGIVAGDIFDKSQIGDRYASTGSLLASVMGHLDNFDCPCFVIAGQHDLSPLGLSAIQPLIDCVTLTAPVVQMHDELMLLMFPWVWPDNILAAEERKDISADELAMKYRAAINGVLKGFAVKAAEHDGPVIFVGHLQVIGAGLPSGIGLEESPRSCCVTREQLLQVGADYYVLGDIHKRQLLDPANPNLGGYMGTLAQMNFGEGACIGVPDRADREGCAAGFEITEWEGRRVVSVEFFESDAPKYHTVGCAIGRSGVPDCTDGDYVRFRDYELDPVISLTPPLVTFERIPQPLESRVRAEDISVDMSLTALLRQWGETVGREVTGTAVLLAEELKPQGEHAASMGSLERIHLIALDHIGPHENTFVELPDGLIGIAGDNGSGKTFFTEAVEATAYGAWASRPGFFQQASSGYEGESRLEIAFQAAGKRYCVKRLIQGSKSQQDAYLFEVQDGDGHIAIAGPKVREVEAAIERIIGSRELVEATIFSSQNSAGDLTEVQPRERQAVLRKLIGADRYEGLHEAAKERRATLAAEISALMRDKEAAEAKAAELPALTLELDRIGAMKAAAEEEVLTHEKALEDIRLRTAEIQVAERQRANAEREASEAADRVVKAEATLATMRERIAKAEASGTELGRIEAELRNFEGIEQQLAQMNALLDQERELRDALHQADTHYKEEAAKTREAERKYEAAKSQAALANDPALGCTSPTKPPPCKLMAAAVAAQAELPKLKEYVDNGHMRDEQKHKKVAELQAEYGRHEFSKLQEQARQLEAKRSQAATLREQKAALAATLANLPELRGQVDDYAHELEHMRAQAAEKAAIVDACEQPDTSQRDLLAQKSTAERLLQQARVNVSKHTQTIGGCEEKIEQANIAGRKAADCAVLIKAKESGLADVDTVAKAFGKDGIPQLLIDTAIPHIQAILDELLEGSDLKLSLSTTRDNKSGTQRETLDINVQGPDGVREIAACSGGERKKLRIVMRLALARFQVQRAGNRYEVLIVDEAFDALDADNRQFVLDCLERLSGFRQIIVVTHADELIAALPSRLYFSKSNGKSIVEVR